MSKYAPIPLPLRLAVVCLALIAAAVMPMIGWNVTQEPADAAGTDHTLEWWGWQAKSSSVELLTVAERYSEVHSSPVDDTALACFLAEDSGNAAEAKLTIMDYRDVENTDSYNMYLTDLMGIVCPVLQD